MPIFEIYTKEITTRKVDRRFVEVDHKDHIFAKGEFAAYTDNDVVNLPNIITSIKQSEHHDEVESTDIYDVLKKIKNKEVKL